MQKMIFVSGPSESGKSSGINFILGRFPEVKHIKIKNIFQTIYNRENPDCAYEAWYNYNVDNRLYDFWYDFVNTVKSQSKDNDVIILDTMYGLDEIKHLYSILKENLYLLFIDAPYEQRVFREYTRLRSDSPYSDRKADLKIKIQDVARKTLEKDNKKTEKNVFDYPFLVINSNDEVSIHKNGRKFTVVINNDRSQEEFHHDLVRYIQSIISESRDSLNG